MATPFPFASGDVLTAAELNSIGEWTSYTPTLTNFTANSMNCWYCQVNKIVFVSVSIDVATMGTNPEISLPVNNLYDASHGQGVTYLDQGNAFFQGMMIPGSNKTSFWTWQVGGTYAFWNQVTATQPFTWVSGDSINGSFYYQAA